MGTSGSLNSMPPFFLCCRSALFLYPEREETHQNSFILSGFTFVYVEVFPVIRGDVTVLVDGVWTTMTPIDAPVLEMVPLRVVEGLKLLYSLKTAV